MSSGLVTALDVAVGGLALVLVSRWLMPRRDRLPLPPGPKGLPFIGNVLDMPTSKEWLTFAAWAERYGDIMSVSMLGQPLVIVNSADVAEALLDKKSALYSDRPFLMMASALVGWDRTLALTPYGPRFRAIRRMLHTLMGTRAALAPYTPVFEAESRRMLRRVLDRPDQIADALRKTAGGIILKISHGYQIQEDADPIVQTVDSATDQFSAVTMPGAFLVDVFHALRHVPAWMPGAGFQRKAAAWRANLDRMADIPHAFVRARVADGTNEPNFTSAHLAHKALTPDEEDTVKWAAASLYSGGADTTVSSTHVFYLAMVLFPEAQAKAQAEIDAVVGTDRLPTADDRASLPYVEALVKEVFRWQPVVPLGVPHRLISEDTYAGHRITAGSIVIPNIWAMAHDARTYVDPLAFRPERFLGVSPERDPRELVFGFGRRICPGQHLADASVWLACALSLAAFAIRPAPGAPLPVPDMSSSAISHPAPFACAVAPRTPRMAALVAAVPLADA